MATRGARVKRSVRQQKGIQWSVLKIALGLAGTFFIVIALIGMIFAHGQAAPDNATIPKLDELKGCVGTDQSSGTTFVKVSCLNDSGRVKVLCENWQQQGLGSPPWGLCNPFNVNGTIVGTNATR